VPGCIHFGFVVDKVALGHVFLRVLWFSLVNMSLHHCSIPIYHRPMRSAKSVTKQHIIKLPVLRGFFSDPALVWNRIKIIIIIIIIPGCGPQNLMLVGQSSA
jgi:hypothetical protein